MAKGVVGGEGRRIQVLDKGRQIHPGVTMQYMVPFDGKHLETLVLTVDTANTSSWEFCEIRVDDLKADVRLRVDGNTSINFTALGLIAPVPALVERFDIDPFSDFSAK